MRSTRQLHPRCEHFAFSCFSYLILSSFVSPLLPLGLGLLLVRGYVRRPMYCRMGLLVLQVFLEFFYWLALTFAKAPDPSGGRGEMAMSHPRCARLFFLHSEPGQDAPARRSVCPTGACSSQLYSAKCMYFNGHRHFSRRPQPRGSGGDATLRKDTRREL